MKAQAYNLKRWVQTGLLPRLGFNKQVRYLGWDRTTEVLDDAVKRYGDHPTKALTLDWLAREPDLPEKVSLLDIGCGPGVLAGMIERHPALRARVAYTGVDQSEAALQYCRAHFPKDYQFLNVNLQREQPPGRYDVAMIHEVVEHLPNYRDIIEAALALGPRIFVLTTFGAIPGLRRDRIRWNQQHQCYMNSYSFEKLYEYLRGKTSQVWMADLGTQEFSRYWFPRKSLLAFYLKLDAEKIVWTQQGWTTQR